MINMMFSNPYTFQPNAIKSSTNDQKMLRTYILWHHQRNGKFKWFHKKTLELNDELAIQAFFAHCLSA